MSTLSAVNPIDFDAIDEENGFVSFPILCQRAAHQNPDLCVLKVEGQSFTWAQLIERVNRVANLLQSRGLGRGDKIAILARSSAEYVAVFLGSLQAGVCAVPLSGMASSDQLAGMLRDSAAKMLFASSSTLDLITPFTGKVESLPEDA